MKKVVSIFLAFIFSLSTMGVQITMHNCQGKTSYIVFGIDFNKHCKCKHDNNNYKHSKGCCDKKSFIVKTIGDGFANKIKGISFEKRSFYKLSAIEYTEVRPNFYKNTSSLSTSKEPPEKSVPINTLNCVFRI